MISIEPPSSAPGDAAIPVLSKAGLTRFLHRAQAAVGVSGQVDVLLADDATLRRLNRRFRGKNKATDVLSFPALSVVDGGDSRLAGDIAISLETAGRQAEAFGHALRDEVRVLLLHGLLHLHGMDHETDAGEMAGREGLLRKELRLPASLIERVVGDGRVPSGMTNKRVAARTEATAAAVGKGKSKGNSSDTSKFPSGMTTKKAEATIRATATERAAAVGRVGL